MRHELSEGEGRCVRAIVGDVFVALHDSRTMVQVVVLVELAVLLKHS